MRRPIALLLLIVILLSGCSATDPLEHFYTVGLTYTGNYYDELVVPANAIGEGWPAPGASNVQSGYAYLFADEPLVIDEKYLHFNLQMPLS